MKPTLMLGSVLSLLAACSQSPEQMAKAMRQDSEERFESAMQDSVFSEVPPYLVSEHRMRGKCSDVAASVAYLENYTRARKGFVEQSELNAELIETRELRIAKDSTATISKYKPVAELKLRIPFYLLDSALLEAGNQLVFMDSRGVSNVLAENKVYGNYQTEAALESKPNDEKPFEKNPNALLQYKRDKVERAKEQASVHSRNISLNNDIMYATLYVSLYGEERSQTDKHLLLEELVPYEPSFLEKAWSNIGYGFTQLEDLVLWIVKNWIYFVLLLLGIRQWRKLKLKNHLPQASVI